ncbi:hypothetical protein EF707_06175 [Vibrio fluvialis]|nr:hypothetical protein [Vibrio fluvialis]
MRVAQFLRNLHTKRLRRIPNAWHFQFDSALVSTAQWFRWVVCVAHHLTRRYATYCFVTNLVLSHLDI